MTDTDRYETDDGEGEDRETGDSEVDAAPTEGEDSTDETGEDSHDATGDEDTRDETSEGAESDDESSEDISDESSEGASSETGGDTRDESSEDAREETGDEESADWEAAEAGEVEAGDENGARDLSSAVAVTGATSEEEAALRRARAVGRLLDEAVRVPGTDFRVGIDPILGILPGAGDAVAAGLSLYPIVEAYRLDAPGGTLAKMVALVAVDAVVGSIPIVGPLFDAVWKANVWNVRALERHLRAD